MRLEEALACQATEKPRTKPKWAKQAKLKAPEAVLAKRQLIRQADTARFTRFISSTIHLQRSRKYDYAIVHDQSFRLTLISNPLPMVAAA